MNKFTKKIIGLVCFSLMGSAISFDAFAREFDGSLYSDKRMKNYAKLYQSSNLKKLMKAALRDLQSKSPHPLSSVVFTRAKRTSAHKSLHKLWAKMPNKEKAALGAYGEILNLDGQNRSKELLSKFKPNSKEILPFPQAYYELSSIAVDYDSQDEQLDYIIAGLKSYPNFFQLAWGFIYLNLSNDQLTKVAKAYKETPEWHDLPLGKIIETRLNHSRSRRINTYETISLMENWLAANPDDPRAGLLLGRSYYNAAKYGLAYKSQKHAYLVSPYYSNYSEMVKTGLKENKADEIIEIMSARAGHYVTNKKGKEAFLNYYLAEGYRMIGYNKTAAKKFNEAISAGIDYSSAYMDKATLLSGQSRKAERVEVIKQALTKKQGDTYSNKLTLVSALTANGNYKEAQEVFETAQKTQTLLTPTAVYRANSIYSKTDKGLQKSFWEKALVEIPNNAGLWRTYAGTIEGTSIQSLTERRDAMQKSFTLGPIGYRANEYFEAEEALLAKRKPRGYKKELLSFVEGLIETYPEITALHDKHLSLLGYKDERKAKYWHDMAVKYPQFPIFYDKWVRLATNEKHWDEARERLAVFGAYVKADGKDNKNSLTLYVKVKLHALTKELKARKVSKDILTALAAELKTNEAIINQINFHDFRQNIYEGLEDKETAAKELLAQAKLNEFNTGIFHDMVALFPSTNKKAWTYGYHMFNESPYNQSILNSFLHKHTMWSGSPVVALWAIDRGEKNGIKINKSYRANALGKLGDNVIDYEVNEGGNYNIINPSTLYIGMYNRRVENVLNKERNYFVFKFDEDRAIIEIHKANGEVIIREDSQKHGKPLAISKGGMAYKFHYIDNGIWTGVSDVKGDIIRLFYDDKSQVVKFQTRGKPLMEFEYNDMKKPILISIAGVGSINIQYDARGQISKVESDQGSRMALQVTQQFQNLLSITNQFGNFIKSMDFPDFKFGNDDEQYTIFENDLKKVKSESGFENILEDPKYILASKNKVNHLVDNLSFKESYLREALNISQNFIETGLQVNQKNIQSQKTAADYLAVWKDLKIIQKPNGLQTHEYLWWVDQFEKLTKIASASNDAHFGKVLAKLNGNGLSILSHEKWLPENNLSNPSFWKHYSLTTLLSTELAEATFNDSQNIGNNAIVFGTSKGLVINSGGRWLWLGFDPRSGQWSKSADPRGLDGWSDVSSIARDKEGNFWLGTKNGVMVVDKSLETIVARYETKEQGLGSQAITDILVEDETVYVANKKGISLGNLENGFKPIKDWKGKNVVALKSSPNSDNLIIQDNTGLYSWKAGKKKSTIFKGPIQGFDWSGDSGVLAFISKDVLYFAQSNNGHDFKKPSTASGQETLLKSKQLIGLKRVDIPDKGVGLAVWSDQGIAFYKDKHFEYMETPLKKKRNNLTLGPRALNAFGGNLWMVTKEGLYSYLKSKTNVLEKVRSTDLQTMEKHNLTFVAEGRRLGVVFPDETGIRTYKRINAKYLAKLDEDTLVVASSRQVVSINLQDQSVTELFALRNPQIDDKEWNGYTNLTSLLVDSRGDIWVTKGDTVHHYDAKTKQVKLFNYALNSEEFPAVSTSLNKVYERPDGKIYVVASRNTHWKYKGVQHSGGLFQYNDGVFKSVETSYRDWFTTGYTQLEGGSYLEGTTTGFSIRNITDDEKTNTASSEMSQLKSKTPGVFLVRDGIKYDDKTYLIPSAGGVLIYSDGQWFPANFLNSQLPGDVKFGQYGSREVYAVEKDKDGRVYVSSRLGLTIFNLPGGVQGLLAENGFSEEAFNRKNVKKLASLNNQFLKRVEDTQSPAGRLLAQISTAKKDEEDSAKGKDKDEKLSSVDTDSREAIRIQEDQEKLKRDLERKRKKTARLMARLENEHRGLFQMLSLNPTETAAIHEKLPEDSIVVQYLPTKETLYIQLTDKKNGAQSISIPVKGALISQRALEVSAMLKARAERLPTLRGIKVIKKDQTDSKIEAQGPDKNSLFVGNLAWLYDQLLRPIEGKLLGFKNVYIVPVGELTYVPFSALVKSVDPEIEYAVEKFQFSSINSLFHLNLILEGKPMGDDRALLIGNADNTLEFAQKEVEEISNYFDDSTLLIGDEAKYDTVIEEMADHGVLHFATHGILDNKTPYNSYLKLADNKQLNVIDISILDLGAANVAVLSACETGLGVAGLEYATMARAFVNAKVPSIIASLWSIDDQATKELMVNFYSHYQNEKGVSGSLTLAQRDMLEIKGPSSWPEAWAGMVLFGKH